MRRGFTMIELLVAIAVIVVLASLLMPVFSRARKGAFETATRSDLRQAWLALSLYREEQGDLPNTPEAAKEATRTVPACRGGNPWEPAGEVMPPPTLGQFGYVRLTDSYRSPGDWQQTFSPEVRYLLASIRYADPMPLKFEGEGPEDPKLLLGAPPNLRYAYPMPHRILLVHDQGSVRLLDRPTSSKPGDPALWAWSMDWPGLFFWAAQEAERR